MPAKVQRVVLVVIFLIASVPAIAQSSRKHPDSPKDVYQRFRQMDAAGKRLTRKGWYEASVFFVKPSPRPARFTMMIAEGEDVGDPKVGGDHAQLWVRYGAFARVDSSGRLYDPMSGRAYQPNCEIPMGQEYRLVHASAHWEFERDGKTLRQVNGPPEWRIEPFDSEPRIPLDIAIHYLTGLRDHTDSPVIRKNAERSLKILLDLRRSKGRRGASAC